MQHVSVSCHTQFELTFPSPCTLLVGPGLSDPSDIAVLAQDCPNLQVGADQQLESSADQHLELSARCSGH
jgi:hypothetical protein